MILNKVGSGILTAILFSFLFLLFSGEAFSAGAMDNYMSVFPIAFLAFVIGGTAIAALADAALKKVGSTTVTYITSLVIYTAAGIILNPFLYSVLQIGEGVFIVLVTGVSGALLYLHILLFMRKQMTRLLEGKTNGSF
ncbi:hypothetical protein CR205_13695 [Alteribacter lacisalsi]|uniref:Uncharacterized protein n=1 Tax=Alteribacter lacisalsi TaxID=2045244 RepID=A0A2W0HT01_9BACI|nr:hypothetical protein [Alteribacter lacisalsi]PYZ96738.1 hypothetical protein CR205_13695 [Alteribacter lacisalsi]